MRANRPTQAPNPVFTTDASGNRLGDRPKVGPADAQTVHAALKAQEAVAAAPRPMAQASVGAEPADNPTKDLAVTTAANRLANYGRKVDAAITDQSQ
jgi:hypothetical protein